MDDLEASIANFHKLIEAGDIPGMLVIASTMTIAQFGTLIRGYNAQFKQAHVMTTLDKVIAPKHKEHKGTHLELLRFAVMQSADPGRHVALLLEESMEGLGTNEDQLSRLVVRNRGKFMEKVKAAYHVDYSRTLADRVRVCNNKGDNLQFFFSSSFGAIECVPWILTFHFFLFYFL